MKRILVLVEGQTEETFVRDVLAPYLWRFDKAPEVTRVANKVEQGRRTGRGGAPAYPKIKREVRLLLASNPDAVTTMLDYYGLRDDFPGKRTLLPGASCFERAAHIEAAFARDIDDPRFIPNLVLHEFEGLLFADPSAIAAVLVAPSRAAELSAVAARHASPEEIDEGPETHPSKHIARILPAYQKPLHGPRIAKRITLTRIRAKCRRFHAWLERLEAL